MTKVIVLGFALTPEWVARSLEELASDRADALQVQFPDELADIRAYAYRTAA